MAEHQNSTGFRTTSKAQLTFRDVYSTTAQFLGAVYLNHYARKWAIKEYPGQWFETQEGACLWLLNRNQTVVKG